MSQACTICGRSFVTKRRAGLYCSPACSQKAYRRRKADQRTKDAQARRVQELNQHRADWIRFFMDSSSCSRKHAERLYTALWGLGRLDGPPWEQLTL